MLSNNNVNAAILNRCALPELRAATSHLANSFSSECILQRILVTVPSRNRLQALWDADIKKELATFRSRLRELKHHRRSAPHLLFACCHIRIVRYQLNAAGQLFLLLHFAAFAFAERYRFHAVAEQRILT